MTDKAIGSTSGGGSLGSVAQSLPTDRLRQELENLLAALAERALSKATSKVTDIGGRLSDSLEDGGPGLMGVVTGGKALAEGKSPLKSVLSAGASTVKEKAKNALPGGLGNLIPGLGGGGDGGGGGGGEKGKIKVTNIVEQIDVGVPVSIAYDQWTQFADWPTFMKKIENVKQESDTELTWKAQIIFSHRDWRSTIEEQVPDERIIWRSEGSKGYVDGAVTFHELAPNLTRVLLVLEYNPKGFFEHTGNIWRAQGRRARLELKHYRRHVMSHVLLHPDDLEGWRGEIREGEVVSEGEGPEEEGEDREGEEEPEGEYGEDEYDEGEGEPREEYEEDEAEYDEEEPEYPEYEDEFAEEEEEPEEAPRRRPARR